MQICKLKIITMLQSLSHSNHFQMLLLLKLPITEGQLLMLGYQTQKSSSPLPQYNYFGMRFYWSCNSPAEKKVLLLLELIPSQAKQSILAKAFFSPSPPVFSWYNHVYTRAFANKHMLPKITPLTDITILASVSSAGLKAVICSITAF